MYPLFLHSTNLGGVLIVCPSSWTTINPGNNKEQASILRITCVFPSDLNHIFLFSEIFILWYGKKNSKLAFLIFSDLSPVKAYHLKTEKPEYCLFFLPLFLLCNSLPCGNEGRNTWKTPELKRKTIMLVL